MTTINLWSLDKITTVRRLVRPTTLMRITKRRGKRVNSKILKADSDIIKVKRYIYINFCVCVKWMFHVLLLYLLITIIYKFQKWGKICGLMWTTKRRKRWSLRRRPGVTISWFSMHPQPQLLLPIVTSSSSSNLCFKCSKSRRSKSKSQVWSISRL